MDQNSIVLVVSVSILNDEEVLIIKENKPTAFDKWNFPSGRIEYVKTFSMQLVGR